MVAKRIWVVVVLMAVLALIAAGAVAIAEEPAQGLAPEAAVPSAFTYQGRLSDAGGTPLDGTYTMQFRIHDSALGPIYYWDSGPLSVNIDEGLFKVVLEPHHAIFDGRELWLRIKVNTDWLTPRQELLPVPYALSLRPGAEIEGDSALGYGLQVNWTNLSATGGALRGESASSTGVSGRSPGGYGVAGYSEDNYAVFGSDAGSSPGHGYGGYFSSTNGVGVYGYSSAESYYTNMYTPGVYGRSDDGVGVYGRSDADHVNAGWKGIGVLGWARNGPGARFVSYFGNLIEGVRDVNGDGFVLVDRFRVEYDGDVFATSYNSPASDFAELLPARDGLEPGDVLVVGTDGQLARSTKAYQPTVVGVYSTKPGFLGGAEDAGGKEVQLGEGAQPAARDKDATVELAANGKVPLAIAGIVPVKVSAENGSITPGDLLVSSATPGHCMRAGDDPPVGTVIGKALEGLDDGTGVIKILVMLQ